MEWRISGGVFVTILAIIGASAHTFWKLDSIHQDVHLVNQFFVPILKQLNVVSGKWSTYQRAFEKTVGFRKWGSTQSEQSAGTLNFRKIIEPNIGEIQRIIGQLPAAPRSTGLEFLRFEVDELLGFIGKDSSFLIKIISFIKLKQFEKAAQIYTQARQDHLLFSQNLLELIRQNENKVTNLQLSIETKLRQCQIVLFVFLAMSSLLSLFSLFKLRRWISPLLQWTQVAKEIATKGLHRDVKFPRVSRGDPDEIAILTREFTRMAMTVLERERTIQQQKNKLEFLNAHLKDQNETLKKLGSLNERILNSMSAGLVVINVEGRIEQFNDKFCEMFCLDRNQLLRSKFEEVLKNFDISQISQTTRVRALGMVLDVRVQLLLNQEGRILSFEDVAKIVEVEEKMSHLQKLTVAGSLSAQVAHELRNPLNAMMLQLEMLQEEVKNEVANTRVKVILEQVDRLERMTRRYLDVNQRGSFCKQKIDIHQLIERGLFFLNQEIQATRIFIQLSFQAQTTHVFADPDAISQVLFNLIYNAIEAMKEQTQKKLLKINTINILETIQISIEDSGSGINSEIKNRIFEPFVTNKASGHGLGLSVSRQICIEHGGELKLIEVQEQVGTAFKIVLPVAKEKQNVTDLSC